MRRTSAFLIVLLSSFPATTVAGEKPQGVVDVVAIVNGEPLLRSTLDEFLAPYRKAKASPAALARIRRRAVQTLITDMLITQYLDSKGFTASEELLDAEMGRARARYENLRERQKKLDRPAVPASFEELLRKNDMSVEKLKAAPPPRMRFRLYVRSGMTEEALRDLFDRERSTFDGKKVQARHILISTKAIRNREGKEAVRKSAERLRERIVAGADFAKLASEMSVCKSGPHGGDLGFFRRRGDMLEGFSKAAFELEVGGISPVVETSLGFHIIEVTGIQPGDPEVKLDDVRSEVETLWIDRRGMEVYGRIIEAAKIERPDAKTSPPPRGARPE
ncbi:MAG: peptidylprolyl isomerase [Planctomycetota bacterium]|jgi:parvulin-like peptidyl-prolyl isomerase